jgi:hypothetical protein
MYWLVQKEYPHLRLLSSEEIDLQRARKVIHEAYIDALELYAVPTLEHITCEDDKCSVELFYNMVNILTFGEYVEFPNVEEQAELSENEEDMQEDFRHDVAHILTVDHFCYENFQEEIINPPILKIW